MGRTFAAILKMTVLAILVIATLSLIQPASAKSETITLSGHVNYPGPNDMFFSPDGANVTARYMGQMYFSTTDSHGDYLLGPIVFGEDYMFAFRINYTDAAGNYYVWPTDDWHETVLPDDGMVVQNLILAKSSAPAPTAMPTVTPSPVITPTPSPTPVPTVSPSPTAGNTTSPTLTDMPTTTPAATKTPSVLLSGAGTMVVLALIGYAIRKKQ
jgi:hypothetical protein